MEVVGRAPWYTIPKPPSAMWDVTVVVTSPTSCCSWLTVSRSLSFMVSKQVPAKPKEVWLCGWLLLVEEVGDPGGWEMRGLLLLDDARGEALKER